MDGGSRGGRRAWFVVGNTLVLLMVLVAPVGAQNFPIASEFETTERDRGHEILGFDGTFSAPAEIGELSVRSLDPGPAGDRAGINAPPWFEVSPLPGGLVRYAHAQCEDNGATSFYIFSGVDGSLTVTDASWRYDADTDTWTELAPVPEGGEGPSAACLEGKIHVMGGEGTNRHFVYDVATDTWTAAAPVPRPVWGAAAAAIEGKVVLAGGDADFFFGEPSDEVNIYDPVSDTWTTGAPMPAAASTPGYAQSGELLFVVGGWGENASNNVDVTQRYDIAADAWETGPTFESARSDLALSATGTAIYAAGGDADAGGPFDPSALVERLDVSAWPSGAWEEVDPLPEALTANRAGACTEAVVGGEIWSVAGTGTPPSVTGRTFYRSTSGEGCTPPDLGKVTGTVFGLLRCDEPGSPLAGATVQIGDFVVETDGDGVYEWWLEEGTYPVTVTIDGYVTQTGEVTVTAGETTTLDFTLRLDAPCADVTPESLEFTVPEGGTDSAELTLTNTGAGAFQFVIEEAPFDVPEDVPWLSVEPNEGEVAGDSSTTVTVTVDATGLEEGTYEATLIITTTDPGAPEFLVPVTFTVEGEVETEVTAWIVLENNGTVGDLTVTRQDIVAVNSDGSVELAFDGSDAGLPDRAVIDGFAHTEDALMLSFRNPTSVPGITGEVDDADIVIYQGGVWSLWFDGNDVDLNGEGEDVDAIEVLADGTILVSTEGQATASGIRVRPEDMLAFTPESLGDDTAGTWAFHFDGSDVGLSGSGENVDAAAVDAAGSIALSTRGALSVPGLTADDDDVVVFDPTSLGDDTAGSFLPDLLLDGSSLGLDANDITAVEVPD